MKSRKTLLFYLALPIVGIVTAVWGSDMPREMYTPLTFSVNVGTDMGIKKLSGIQFKPVTQGAVYSDLNSCIKVVLTKKFPANAVPYSAINSKLRMLPGDSPSSSVFPDGVAVNIRLYVLVGSTYTRIVTSGTEPGLSPSEPHLSWIGSFGGDKPYSGIFGGDRKMEFDFSLIGSPPQMISNVEYPVFVQYIIPNYVGNSASYQSSKIKIGDLRKV